MKIITRFFFFFLIIMYIFNSPAFSQTVSKSTIDDQTVIEVTVYNNNLALIKDTRKIELPVGEGELRFMDVASYIMPETVLVKSLNSSESLTILEQNYEYDLMNENKLLDKYVGKKIKIVDWNEFKDRKDIVEAVLLSNNQGQIYKINDEIYLGHPGYKILPEIPENLIAKPTLTWLYENKTKEQQNIEVSYLTNNITWKADYVMVLNKDDLYSDLSGWITLDNRSGAIYKNASLKLVAGEVNRVEEEKAGRKSFGMLAMARRAPSPQFEEQAFFEYHIYDLQRKTTLKENQTKQINLLEAFNAKIKKEYLIYGIKSYFTMQYREQNPKQPVTVYVKFQNSKENNLGMPLPAGIIRLYKQDTLGKQQFIGEDKIEHTPKDEEVKLKIGEVFDIVAERRQIDYKQLSTQLHESEWEILIKNHKEENVIVSIIEPLYGNWAVINNSHPYEKMDAFTIKFDVEVPKNKEVKVKYKIKVGL